MFNGLHHATIVSGDAEKAAAIFKLIGFNKVAFDCVMSSEEAGALGIPNVERSRNIMLQKEGVENAMVELIEFQTADGRSLGEQSPIPCGLKALSVEVIDAQKAYDDLHNAGTPMLRAPIEMKVPGFGLCKIVVFLGPDGVFMELFERL